MSSSLLSLVDNLSDIYAKEFRGCRKEKIKTVCDFGRLKNNNYMINATNVKQNC